MKYSDLTPPNRIGFDGDTFRAVDSKGEMYDCYCPKCNGKITEWATWDMRRQSVLVECEKWDVIDVEDVIIVKRENKLF